MQKSWLDMRMQNRLGKRPFRCVEKKAAASIFRGGDTVSEKIVFGIGINNEEVSIILSSHHSNVKRFVASKMKRRMSIKAFCTGGGYRRDVAKRKVEDPVDLICFVALACQREEEERTSMPATLSVGARQDEQLK